MPRQRRTYFVNSERDDGGEGVGCCAFDLEADDAFLSIQMARLSVAYTTL
jgi:hypothetical protein